MENTSKFLQKRNKDNLEENQQDDFDREYSLSELLSVSVLDDLCGEIQKIMPIPIAVLMQEGSSFYVKGSFPRNNIEAIKSILHGKAIESPKAFKTAQGKITIFPIVHELEAIGYLVIGPEPDNDRSLYPVSPLGKFLSKTITHLMVSKYKYELTAGLHGQVVEDSYARLNKNSALLEKSEQRYRKLAEKLEIEVQKKTQKIKEAQSQLIQQEKMASIGHLAAGVANEINNPMGFVSSNLTSLNDYEKDIRTLIDQYRSFLSELKEGLASEGQAPIMKGLKCITQLEHEINIDFIMEDIPNLIKESLEGSARIKKIVIDLKDFSHPGEDELQFSDINKSLDSTLNVVWNEIKYKATVTKRYGNLPLVKCYPQRLNQVFMNILVNAAQAIEANGKITIETLAENGSVKVIISDTGKGISKENLSKIFDPFFTTKEVGQGTGLGLNVAYNIIEKHNGTINVKSIEGKGTTFSISLLVDNH